MSVYNILIPADQLHAQFFLSFLLSMQEHFMDLFTVCQAVDTINLYFVSQQWTLSTCTLFSDSGHCGPENYSIIVDSRL